jgi:cobalamin synthase
VIMAFSAYCYWKIGGATGDTLGASCEPVSCRNLLGWP